MFTKTFERRVYLAVGVALFSVALGVGFGVYALWPSHAEAGYSPAQPFPFDHKIHAGTLQIDCQYCHANARKSAHATVPQLSICMNCHKQVQPKDANGKLRPAIATLLDHWEKREPIEWIKVNDVADFVYFDHSRHINSNIACQTCHGPVETMQQMRRQEGLKMAFCISCHMQEKPNDSQTVAVAGSPEMAAELVPHPGTGTRAPTNCTTCHR